MFLARYRVPGMTEEKNSGANNPISSFIRELSRRRVLQIGGAYIAGAWLAAEILNFLFIQFQAPEWSYRLLAILLVVGFPISMVVAWVVQVGEDGTWEIDPSRGDHKTLAIAISLGVLVTAGLSWLILPQREPPPVYQPLPASLAVLPFANPLATPHERTMAETLYRSLMEGLERSAELTLIRLGPGEQPGDLVKFGKSLGVAGLASGGFQRSGNSTLVEIQLLDIVTGDVGWTESFTWDASNIPDIANAIANGLLRAMTLEPIAQERFIGTRNAEAYSALLDGQRYSESMEPGQLEQAIGQFQQAIDLDPAYTQAYVGLAQAIYGLLESGSVPEAEKRALEERARKAVNIAQKLEPDSADAISLLGLQLDNRQLRIQAYERALELDPDHAISFYRYARDLQEDGQLEEAERLVMRAIKLEPRNMRYRTLLVDILLAQGREEEARSEREKIRSFQP
jgi:tetratricopeptide (TPR) repeat protein